MDEQMMGSPMAPDAESKQEDTQEGKEESFPTIPLNSLQVPQVVDWEDGQDYKFTVTATQSNKRVEQELTTADFTIKSIDVA